MKNRLLKIINPLIGLLMVNQFVTALFHTSIPFEVFAIIHGYAGFLLFSLILVHITLNWSWLKANYFKKSKVKKLKPESVIP